jgi:hypothetical protein
VAGLAIGESGRPVIAGAATVKSRRVVVPPPARRTTPGTHVPDPWALRKQRWIRRSKFVVVWRLVTRR